MAQICAYLLFCASAGENQQPHVKKLIRHCKYVSRGNDVTKEKSHQCMSFEHSHRTNTYPASQRGCLASEGATLRAVEVLPTGRRLHPSGQRPTCLPGSSLVHMPLLLSAVGGSFDLIRQHPPAAGCVGRPGGSSLMQYTHAGERL